MPVPVPSLFGESGDVARDGGADLLRGGEVAGDSPTRTPGEPVRGLAFFFRLFFLASAAIKAAMFGLTYPPPPRDAEGRSMAVALPVRDLCTARPEETGFGEVRFGVTVPRPDIAGEDDIRIVDSSGRLRSSVLAKSGAGDVTTRLNVLPGCGDPRV